MTPIGSGFLQAYCQPKIANARVFLHYLKCLSDLSFDDLRPSQAFFRVPHNSWNDNTITASLYDNRIVIHNNCRRRFWINIMRIYKHT